LSDMVWLTKNSELYNIQDHDMDKIVELWSWDRASK
jgi:hypothetical protein